MAELCAQKYPTNEPVCANLEFEVINTDLLQTFRQSGKQTYLSAIVRQIYLHNI